MKQVVVRKVFYQPCASFAEQSIKITALVSDWLIHFVPLLINRFVEFDDIDGKQVLVLNVFYQMFVL